MIARSHYDRFTLKQFLNNALPETDAPPELDSDIAVHLEECQECQSTLESLLGEGLTMEAAGELLRDGAAEELTWGPNGSDRSTELDRSTFLEASEHPGSLGRFARFEIMEFLGRGGMGIVMRGYDTSLNRHSAVKVLAPELATSAAARKRFSREAKSAAAVVHPHVVPIQTVDEHDGLPYLVMPVVEGQSVDSRVRNSGPVSVIEAVRIASQIAEGLAAAHGQGLVHRDIKPANVLLENGVERVQITDFGLARAIDDASMTRSGVIAGTPQYMSPEQAHGDSIDHRSDLFSLGSLIYFMLTGHSPFRAETTMGVLNRIGNEQPRSLRSINPDTPEWLERIVMKLLAKPPEDRFQTASEVAELLEDCLAHVQQPTTVPLPEAVAELVKSFGSHGGTIPVGSFGNFRYPPIGKLIATAAFAFSLIFGGVLIVLELNKGTLAIESEVDDVPIRIMQGDQIVKQLTVSRRGVTTRLSAGKYVIEVDDSSAAIELLGNQVTLKRGQSTLARISLRNQPQAVGDESRLIQHVDAFNRRNQAEISHLRRSPLTVDELICFARWKLETDHPLTDEHRQLLTDIGVGRRLPDGWSIAGGKSEDRSNKVKVVAYHILLNHPSDRLPAISVRQRFDLLDAAAVTGDEATTLLQATITEFNAMHNKVDGLRQPPLTLEEVLAAILDWKHRRNEAPVDNKTFANFMEIAKTHRLPEDARFEVLRGYQSSSGDVFRVWSVRILMPQVAKPGSTYAFTIREQFLGVRSAFDTKIHWGKPNQDGLQAGFRLSPGQQTYQATQTIETEFFYRSIQGENIPVTLPNIFSHRKLIARDSDGNALDVVELPNRTVGGARQTEIGESPTSKPGRPLELGYITPDQRYDSISPSYTYLTVKDGQKVFLTYVVSDLNGGELQTGELVIDISGTSPASHSLKP